MLITVSFLTCRCTILIKSNCTYSMYLQIEEVMLVIPFSRNVRTANLTVTVGTILFDESSKVRTEEERTSFPSNNKINLQNLKKVLQVSFFFMKFFFSVIQSFIFRLQNGP